MTLRAVLYPKHNIARRAMQEFNIFSASEETALLPAYS